MDHDGNVPPLGLSGGILPLSLWVRLRTLNLPFPVGPVEEARQGGSHSVVTASDPSSQTMLMWHRRRFEKEN